MMRQILLLALIACAHAEGEASGEAPASSPEEGKPEGGEEKPAQQVKGIDTSSWTPLHFAAWTGNETALQMLLATNEFPLEQKDDIFGMTPLLLASYRGHQMAVKKLLGAGAYVLVKCKKGKTPLEYAQGKGHKNVIGLLEKAERAALTPDEEKAARMGAFFLLIVSGIFVIWQFWESRKMKAPPLTRSEKAKDKEMREKRKAEAKKKQEKKLSKKKEKESKKTKEAEAEKEEDTTETKKDS